MAETITVEFNRCPEVMNFPVIAGETWELPIALQFNNVAKPLTGCTITQEVRDESGLVHTIEYATILPDVEADGYLTARLTPTDTAGWHGVYHLRLRLQWAPGDSHLPIGGKRTVLEAVLTVV
jgi:hypothetical protein